MSSLYNIMGNLTAVKEVFFGGGRGVGWGMHKGVVVVGVGGGWLNLVDGPAIFRSEEEVPDF